MVSYEVRALAAVIKVIRAGWCRGVMEDEGGRHCIVGAIVKLGIGQLICDRLRKELEKRGLGGISHFNDSCERKSDVIRVLLEIKEEWANGLR